MASKLSMNHLCPHQIIPRQKRRDLCIRMTSYRDFMVLVTEDPVEEIVCNKLRMHAPLSKPWRSEGGDTSWIDCLMPGTMRCACEWAIW